MKRTLILLGALLLTAAAAVPEAAAPITALDQALIAAMQSGKATPFVQRYNALKPVIAQAFDLEAILQTSVGPRWASFTPAQQQALMTEFVRFTVCSYVSNFDGYSGEKFETLPDQRSIGSEQVVATRLIPASGTPNKLDYVMRQGGSGWRAVDVLLDGSISRVAVQRSDFRSVLASGGPDALVASLRKKVADLSGGATVP